MKKIRLFLYLIFFLILSNCGYEPIYSKNVNRDKIKGIIIGSSVNFYDPDITEEEVENFYNNIKVPDPKKPISLGLNSKLVREDGVLKEKVWKKGGMYSESIEKIIENLEIAKKYAENKKQADALGLLIKYYETGDLKIWDDYNVAWVNYICFEQHLMRKMQ